MRGIWAGGILAAAISAAGADQLEDAKECAAITDSLQRLTCFDRAFPKTDAAPATDEAASTVSATWDVRRERSDIDDSPAVYATLSPIDSSGTGILNRGLTLLVRCSENTTSVMLHTDMFMSDNPRVTIRFGNAPAETTRWSRSSNYQAAGLWSGGQSIPFLRKLKNGERLVVRVEARERQDAVFNLGNVEEVVSEVATACNWTL